MIIIIIVVVFIIFPYLKNKYKENHSKEESIAARKNETNRLDYETERKHLKRLGICFLILLFLGTSVFIGIISELKSSFEIILLVDFFYFIPTILLVKIARKMQQLIFLDEHRHLDESQNEKEAQQNVIEKKYKPLSEIADSIIVCKQENELTTCLFNEQELKEFYPHTQTWRIKNWHADEFDYVKKGEELLTLEALYDSNHHFSIKAPSSGFLHIKQLNFHDYHQDDLICEIYSNMDSLIDTLSVNEIKVVKDDFSEDIIIRGEKMAGSQNGFIIGDISINFENRMGEYGLIVKFTRKTINIRKNDTLQLLFDNGTTISLNTTSSPIKCVNCKEDSVVRFGLNAEHINLFKDSYLLKWQIKSSDSEIIGRNEIHHQDKGIGLVFNDFIIKFENEVKNNIPESEIIKCKQTFEPEKQENALECCYVYLMKDCANHFFKIGISNNPKYREKTLQSEKPTIELICNKKFPSRKMARAIESALHTTFSNQHIRGEWFDLNENDVAEVINTLS